MSERARDSLFQLQRQIKDAIFESSTDTGFEGLPHDRADTIIRWFAEREAAAQERTLALLRARMDEAIVTHGVGEMTELLARLIAEIEGV